MADRLRNRSPIYLLAQQQTPIQGYQWQRQQDLGHAIGQPQLCSCLEQTARIGATALLFGGRAIPLFDTRVEPQGVLPLIRTPLNPIPLLPAILSQDAVQTAPSRDIVQ